MTDEQQRTLEQIANPSLCALTLDDCEAVAAALAELARLRADRAELVGLCRDAETRLRRGPAAFVFVGPPFDRMHLFEDVDQARAYADARRGCVAMVPMEWRWHPRAVTAEGIQ